MTDADVDTTHAEGCWAWGPKHHACAVREIERLRARVAELERDAALGARVRKAVKRAHAHFGSTHDRIIAANVINHLAEEGGKR